MRLFPAVVTAALVLAPSVASAATVYNSTPADGWFYGNGNDYSPANTAVLTASPRGGDDQLYLRWHQTGQPAPASVGSVYSFALGTAPLSFDWGYDVTGSLASRPNTVFTPTLTITNLGTGQFFTYNPSVDPTNAKANDSTQNSARLNFAFLSPVGFDANVNDTYRVSLTVAGLATGTQTLFVDAQIGDGATAAVPEVATWAMMVGGFGMVGGALRRRRTTVRFA